MDPNLSVPISGQALSILYASAMPAGLPMEPSPWMALPTVNGNCAVPGSSSTEEGDSRGSAEGEKGGPPPALAEEGDLGARKAPGPKSSKYVGVSRRGDKWVALKYEGKKRKWLGTYGTEEEAARAFFLHVTVQRAEQHSPQDRRGRQGLADGTEAGGPTASGPQRIAELVPARGSGLDPPNAHSQSHSPSASPSQPQQSPREGGAVFSKILLVCCFGGALEPGLDGGVEYRGGEKRMIGFPRSMAYQALCDKLAQVFGQVPRVKYQLMHDRDLVISVSNDEDVENMLAQCQCPGAGQSYCRELMLVLEFQEQQSAKRHSSFPAPR